MRRPWKVIEHRIVPPRSGNVVERVRSFSTLDRAVEHYRVAVFFDVTARLEYRGGPDGEL